MIKRLLLLATMSVLLSGCYMAPMALLGPATSGWTTASIVQSGITTSANYLVKRSTGKTIMQHAFESINNDIIQQSYFPTNETTALIISRSELNHILRN